jgi:hypothetical protein
MHAGVQLERCTGARTLAKCVASPSDDEPAPKVGGRVWLAASFTLGSRLGRLASLHAGPR